MILLDNVKASYPCPAGGRKTIFQDLNLRINRGEFVIVLGTNGSGKSTLFKLLSGEKLPDHGSIMVGTRDVTRLGEEKRAAFMGRVFQNPEGGSASELTLRENLAVAALRGKKRSFWLRGVKKHDEEQMLAMLKRLNMGLENLIDQPMGTLSGGQRQCVTLLMATLNQPEVLLLDEHTSALDPVTQEKVMDLTQACVENLGVTTLCITHNMAHALKYGNRIIIVRHGEIVMDLPAADKNALEERDLNRILLGKTIKPVALSPILA